MTAGDVEGRVRQDPVVLQRSAYCAAFFMELAHVVFPDQVAVLGYDFDRQRHGIPLKFIPILRQVKDLDWYTVHIITACPMCRPLICAKSGPASRVFGRLVASDEQRAPFQSPFHEPGPGVRGVRPLRWAW